MQPVHNQIISKENKSVLMYHKVEAYFSGFQGRKNHLKKCANKLGVSTAVLLERVNQQEKERRENLAAGILPTITRY